MKRKTIILLLMLLACAAGVRAQNSLLDMLKGAASTAVDKATGGALTAQRIVGTWSYAKPGLRLSSDNALSEIAAAAAASTAEEKMAKYYEMVGIRDGACTFVFNDDGTFSSTVGSKSVSGKYEMDGTTHTLKLVFGAGADIERAHGLNASAYMNGSNLQILFAADKLLDALQFLGNLTTSLQTVSSLLESYDGMMIGFEFSPQQ